MSGIAKRIAALLLIPGLAVSHLEAPHSYTSPSHESIQEQALSFSGLARYPGDDPYPISGAVFLARAQGSSQDLPISPVMAVGTGSFFQVRSPAYKAHDTDTGSKPFHPDPKKVQKVIRHTHSRSEALEKLKKHFGWIQMPTSLSHYLKRHHIVTDWQIASGPRPDPHTVQLLIRKSRSIDEARAILRYAGWEVSTPNLKSYIKRHHIMTPLWRLADAQDATRIRRSLRMVKATMKKLFRRMKRMNLTLRGKNKLTIFVLATLSSAGLAWGLSHGLPASGFAFAGMSVLARPGLIKWIADTYQAHTVPAHLRITQSA